MASRYFPSLSRKEILDYLFLFFCLFFTFTLFFRNLPLSEISRRLDPWYDRVTQPLGLYHNGWGVFAGPLTSTFMVKVDYEYKDGTVETWHPFRLRSSFPRNIWTEAMEKMTVFDNNNDTRGEFRIGFLNYECRRLSGGDNPLHKVSTNLATFNMSDLFVDHGQLNYQPTYQVVNSVICPTTP